MLECEANPGGIIMPKAWGTLGPWRALAISAESRCLQ